MKKFWNMSSGSYKIDLEDLHIFLKERGYYSFKPKNVKTVILVKVEENKVRQVEASEIRECCWRYIESEYQFKSDDERKQVKNVFQQNLTYFNKQNIVLLPEIQINEINDDATKSYLFFNNCILEITASRITKRQYSEIDGHVLETDIINFNLYGDVSRIVKLKSEFYEFLNDICKHKNHSAELQNLESLQTLIGYLLHRYKTQTNARAVILMDTYIDGNPNGGTGKGLLTTALGHVRNVVPQDGKLTSTSDKFFLSNVDYGTRILVFNDVPKNFDFEKIFPLISENAVIERKYENKFTIPFEESPKILISTNYTIKGWGISHIRRRIEFILAETFNAEYTPEDRFGHLLFGDWGLFEWTKFYMTMAKCIQCYLQTGIIEPTFNVLERKLKMEATDEFIQFITENVEAGIKYNKKDVYEDFYTKFPSHFKIEMTTFRNWLKFYADAYVFGFHESRSGNDNFFEFSIQ